MSRLDHHVAAVQNKLALNRFLDGLALSVPVFGLLVWTATRVDHLLGFRLPRVGVWFWSGAALAVATALGYAIFRRPTAHEAAVKIDEKLNTKDKFATALHVRTMSDPFAHATLLDAEHTAETVNLHKKFQWSPQANRFPLIAIGCVAVLLALTYFLSPMDPFGKKEIARKQADQQATAEKAKKTLQDALATVSTIPKALEHDESIKLAKEQILQQLNQGTIDPARANRTAAKALQDVNEAIKQQVKSNQKFAEAQQDAKMLRQLQVPIDEKGPVADAQRELAKGNFDSAVNELNKAVENFDKMEKKDQEAAAQQMKNMAQQLQQMANNPQQQQQLQQQLQQMGMNQQQAQQAQDLMQKAAQGDQKAAQQLQQVAQNMMRQMNNGQGPNQQQQQQIQQMMKQLQAQANNQQQAAQMAQAAQQMAQAMQQAAKQQAQQQQQQQNAQNGAQKQQGQGQQQNQQMAQAQQQMQQQLQQMQAQAQDAQEIAAKQQQMQQAADAAMAQCNGGAQQNDANAPGNRPGQGGQGGWNANGQIQGDPNKQNQPWNGQAGQAGPNQGGLGAGDRSYKQQAPYQVKKEFSPSLDDEKGKILASTLVKASALNNGSKEQLKEVAESAIKDAADEIDQDRVSRQAQRVVRDYFGSMQKDAETAPAPATAPSN